MAAADEAAFLIEAHGPRAQQILVDEIVAAIRAGDDQLASARGDVLNALENALSFRSHTADRPNLEDHLRRAQTSLPKLPNG